jgi:hypothetical protein
MTIKLIRACQNTTDSMTQTQNVTAITTQLFAEDEETIVTDALNDPVLASELNSLTHYAKLCTAGVSANTRAYYEAQINKYQALVQTDQTRNQQYEQQWDARTQAAQNESTTISTDIQQVVQIAQASVTASGFIANLLSSPL